MAKLPPCRFLRQRALKNALGFCEKLSKSLTSKDILNIPKNLACTRHGFQSALLKLNGTFPELNDSGNICELLISGERSLEQLKNQYFHKQKTYKWKIGALGFEQEKEDI